MEASDNGRVATVKLLVEERANVEAKDLVGVAMNTLIFTSTLIFICREEALECFLLFRSMYNPPRELRTHSPLFMSIVNSHPLLPSSLSATTMLCSA